MGQEGYALSIPSQPGFIDDGNWSFDGSKSNMLFESEDFADYQFVIKQLQSRKMKLEGKFPFDTESKVHSFELETIIDEL